MPNNEIGTPELVDRLQVLVNDARAIPLSNKVLIDRDVIGELARNLVDSVPVDVKKAAQILDKENEIISASQKQAEEKIREAQQAAKKTMDDAKRDAEATLNNAAASAAETIRAANERAAAILSDAQGQHSSILQEAQNRANQMVSEHEIVTRAKAEAQELRDTTQHDCDEYFRRVHEALDSVMEQADNAMARQLDDIRALRQQMNSGA